MADFVFGLLVKAVSVYSPVVEDDSLVVVAYSLVDDRLAVAVDLVLEFGLAAFSSDWLVDDCQEAAVLG